MSKDSPIARFAYRNPLGCDYSTLRATICCKTRDSEIYVTKSINSPIHLFVQVLQMA